MPWLQAAAFLGAWVVVCKLCRFRPVWQMADELIEEGYDAVHDDNERTGYRLVKVR
jgi:hypothetical protein